jgi:hypothetical protein
LRSLFCFGKTYSGLLAGKLDRITRQVQQQSSIVLRPSALFVAIQIVPISVHLLPVARQLAGGFSCVPPDEWMWQSRRHD